MQLSSAPPTCVHLSLSVSLSPLCTCTCLRSKVLSVDTIHMHVGWAGLLQGVTAFVVPRGTPGFTVGGKEIKLGIRGSSTVIFNLDNCTLTPANRLGKDGDGFKIAMVHNTYSIISTSGLQ